MSKYTIGDVELVQWEEVDNGSLFIDNGYLLKKEDEQWSTVIEKLELLAR